VLSRADRALVERIARGRGGGDLHLLEGAKAVREALAGGHVARLWLRRDLDDTPARELAQGARKAGVPVGEGTRQEFDRLGDTVRPQGVLALVEDTVRPLEQVVALPGLLLWLDGVQDPGNVGAVVRVAAGLGAAGLLVGTGSADPLGTKALRASAGLALRVPFARASSGRVAETAQAAGRPVWGLDASGDDVRTLGGEVPADLVLALGAEGQGLGEVARRVAVRTLAIPLAPGVDSLNVAVAAGIAAWALVGQSRR